MVANNDKNYGNYEINRCLIDLSRDLLLTLALSHDTEHVPQKDLHLWQGC